MRILLVEDDKMIGTAVQQGLNLEGYAVDWVQDAEEAELVLETEPYELVLLDQGLPDRSGLEVLSDFRKRGEGATVLILTARDAITDRIAGLDCGADDYLVLNGESTDSAEAVSFAYQLKLRNFEDINTSFPLT